MAFGWHIFSKTTFMDTFITQYLTALSTNMLILHGTSILLTVLCFLFVRKILKLGRRDDPPAIQVVVLRLCLLAYFLFEVVDIVLLHALPKYNRPLYSGALSILTLFAAILLCNFFNKWARKRFGTEKVIDGQKEVIPTYYSRLTGLLFSIVISIKVVYLLVKIWQMDSLLQTTGFVGVIAAFLVLTNAIWLPDIYYGLVILNSDMFEDGEAVRFTEQGPIYVINRISLIYTTLLNVENNNKAMIRNSKIMDNKIENLTRRASVEGLRQSLSFKVSYPKFDDVTGENGEKDSHLRSEVDRYYHKLETMFKEANEYVQKNSEESIAQNTPFDWGIVNAGDYALEIIMHYYLAPLPATKLTKKLRKIIYESRKKVVHAVYMQSIIHGIELSTPTLVNIDSPRALAQARKNLKLKRAINTELMET